MASRNQSTRTARALKAVPDPVKVLLNDKGEVLPDFTSLTGIGPDKSSFNPGATIASLNAIVSELPDWKEASERYENATASAARTLFAMRRDFYREGGEQIDWAAYTNAWSIAFQYLKSECKLAGVDPQKFQSRTGAWLSRNNYAVQAIAMWCCEVDPKLGRKTAIVGEGKTKHSMPYSDIAANPHDGQKIPAELAAAIAVQYEAQVDKSGKRLEGWQVVPSSFGPSGKASRKGGSGGGDGKVTPDRAWGLIRANVANLDPRQSLNEIMRVLTKLSDHVIGAPDTKYTIEDGLIPEKGAFVSGLRELAAFAEAMSDYLHEDPPGTTVPKEKVTRYRVTADK